MKNWIRIFLICFVLVGGTAFFAYQSLNQFNIALDDISVSASAFAIANTPSMLLSDKTNKEQISTSTPETISTSTPETTLVSTSSTDLKPSFVFPKIDKEVYTGCTYRISFQSSATTGSLQTALVDAGVREIIEPIASGLAKENKIEPNSQSLDWKVGALWPGEYYIKVTDINGIVLRSKVFAIRKMSKDISVDEREKICKESEGSF